MADAVRVEVRAVAVVVLEMRSREVASAYFNCASRDVQTPIPIVINLVAGSQKEASDIAAEIQDGTALPGRPFQQLVEVLKLCLPTRNVGCHGPTPTLERCQHVCERYVMSSCDAAITHESAGRDSSRYGTNLE